MNQSSLHPYELSNLLIAIIALLLILIIESALFVPPAV